MSAPKCIECGELADLVTGKQIYPHRPDLHKKPIWLCSPCGAYVGCHPGTENPLGYPAGEETRKARSYVHRVMDPIWQNAPAIYKDSGKSAGRIKRAARSRVYAYLADQMKIDAEDCHTGMFNHSQCRQAYAILKDLDYATVRQWAKETA